MHHDPGAANQHQQGHELLKRVGDHVVGVGDLFGLKAALQIRSQVVAITGFELRFKLQTLDGFKPAYIFGDKGLVSRAQQKLLVQPYLKYRCY